MTGGTAERLRILGDETRLRIVRLLREESLNVGELMGILGLAQPTVSKHLAELRRVGLVEVERASGYSFYRLAEVAVPWWEHLASSLSEAEDAKRDLVRLEEIRTQRADHSEVQDRFVVPGRSWLAWSRGLRFLLPALTVADFGCGDGAVTVEIAAWARRVFAIDCNEALLRVAREKAAGFDNIEFRAEAMEHVSLPARSVDLVVISQSLHYLDEPEKAIAQARRILKPGGRVLILDLLPHREEWVVPQLRHRRLGFESSTLTRMLKEAGFVAIQTDTRSKQGPEPFRVIIVTATRPARQTYERNTK
jgi:SAM-dependent methyltransferase/DNA-binding HxlR family transcriptional regulator